MRLLQARDAEREKSPYSEYVNIYTGGPPPSASRLQRFLSYSPFLAFLTYKIRECPLLQSFISLGVMKRLRGGGESCRVVVVLPLGSGVCAGACVRRGHLTHLGMRDAFLLDASKFAQDILHYWGEGTGKGLYIYTYLTNLNLIKIAYKHRVALPSCERSSRLRHRGSSSWRHPVQRYTLLYGPRTCAN